jgi:uncharacterized protein with HEPN domain
VYIKISTICNIQLLAEKTGTIVPDFKLLEKMSHKELADLRDRLIIGYNDNIEARRFAAEMIYKR